MLSDVLSQVEAVVDVCSCVHTDVLPGIAVGHCNKYP